MGTRALTRELYGKMLEAFREEPGNVSAASRASGCSRATAARAWHHGWGKGKPWARAISAVLQEEAEAARQLRIRQEIELGKQEMERQLQARLDAIQARAEESAGAKASRKNALNLAVVTGKMIVLVDAMTGELKSRIGTPAGLAALTPKDMQRWMQTVSAMAHRAETVMRLALEIERIVAGEPIAVIGVRTENMTPEAMVKELTGMSKTLARAERLRSAASTPESSPDGKDADNAKDAN